MRLGINCSFTDSKDNHDRAKAVNVRQERMCAWVLIAPSLIAKTDSKHDHDSAKAMNVRQAVVSNSS